MINLKKKNILVAVRVHFGNYAINQESNFYFYFGFGHTYFTKVWIAISSVEFETF